MTVIYAPELYPKKRPSGVTAERDRYLLSNKHVCAKSLAADLGVTERFIVRYQRKLGIRPMAGGWKPRGLDGQKIDTSSY